MKIRNKIYYGFRYRVVAFTLSRKNVTASQTQTFSNHTRRCNVGVRRHDRFKRKVRFMAIRFRLVYIIVLRVGTH